MIDNSINAGPRAQNGFSLQRNTALYILLTEYEIKFKNNKYFICLEHHDDFLFCFLDENGSAKKIDAYQSKKKSPTSWTINKEFGEILKKVLSTGNRLRIDTLPKSTNYHHNLHFTTNQTIKLEDTPSNLSISVNEENCLITYNELADEIKQKIKKQLIENFIIDNETELQTLHFLFVDLNRTDEKQIKVLRGELEDLLGNSSIDSKAGIITLISLFEKIEKRYNQGNQTQLLDISKRVSSQEIEHALSVITTKSKAFDYWRSEEREIKSKLFIKPYEKECFEYTFLSAFDLFKSNEELEHKKILNFIEANYTNSNLIHEEEIIEDLYNKIVKSQLAKISGLELKATIYAGYFEVINKKQS